MSTTLLFTVPLELRVAINGTPSDDAYDVAMELAHEQVRQVLSRLTSDDPDVRIFAGSGDLPEPIEEPS